jgi:hypothetical protein
VAGAEVEDGCWEEEVCHRARLSGYWIGAKREYGGRSSRAFGGVWRKGVMADWGVGYECAIAGASPIAGREQEGRRGVT